MNSSTLHENLLNQLQLSWSGLPDKPDETPESTLQSLWQYVCGLNRLVSEQPIEIDNETEQRLRGLVAQRIEGMPLAYITGHQVFMGIEFLSSPDAMIPRKETEILGKAALEKCQDIARCQGNLKVMDICTGSGNIALTLAFYEPSCYVVGADLSMEAIQLAQRNAEHLGLTERSHFYQGDLFAPFENEKFLGQMDLVTCNPPYISSPQVEKLPEEIARHEPRLAFDGGPYGIRILNRFLREAPRFLRQGGQICFEVGLGQGKAITGVLVKSGNYGNISTFLDDAGEIRAIAASLISPE